MNVAGVANETSARPTLFVAVARRSAYVSVTLRALFVSQFRQTLHAVAPLAGVAVEELARITRFFFA